MISPVVIRRDIYPPTPQTFALPRTTLSDRQLEIWYAVRDAQTAALEAAKNGTFTRVPDQAARAVLKPYGWEKYFTHRLGHGIGLQIHESPYLRGGSDDIILSGHTFSDEPGVYIADEVCGFLNYDEDTRSDRYICTC